MKRTKLELAILYILSGIIVLYAFLPFLWVFLTALKSPEQIYDVNQIRSSLCWKASHGFLFDSK